MKPYILKEAFPTGDVCVITTDVDVSALTPAADATFAIQSAIDACAAAGGGTVYLPAGVYTLRGYLTIATAVTLRGEWVNPDVAPGAGTILCCYAGKNDPHGIPQITMKPCTGLKNVTLYYPEQTVESPTPYSPTVRQNGADSINVHNVTFVNPWRGVQCGSDGNELHYLKNVYMTPVNTGFFMDVTTDIGRMENLNIRPKYWEEFTLAPGDTPMDAATRAALRRHMLDNVTGVFMARSDWEYGYDVMVEGCNIGFTITTYASGGPNAQICRLIMHNCRIGFRLISVNAYGVALSDSRITADMPGLTAAIVCDGRFKTVMQFNGVDMSGCYPYMVLHEGRGQLSFVNCVMEGWRDTAVRQTGGGLSMLQCRFGAGHHLQLTDGVGGTQILGCTFDSPAAFDVSDAARSRLQYSDAPLGLSVAPKSGHKFRTLPAQPANPVLYNAVDFGAVPVTVDTAETAVDNTAAIQAALDAAGKTGGVVFLPGGWYRCDGTLAVPSGVELRGVFEVPSHTMGGGSVLRTYTGKGDEDASPFLTLAPSSGIRGLVIQHPEQHPEDVIPFPWAVQSRGENTYAIDIVTVNAWRGLDFGTYPSKGHYLSYISGAPIRCGIFVGNCAGEGWVENVQYNPHYWGRSNFENRTQGNQFRAFWHNQIKYLDALKFGYTEDEHLLGTFVFAAKHGLHFVMQNGRGAKGTFIGHGTDGGEIGLCVEGVEDVDLINTELVSIESPQTRIYFKSMPDAPGKVRVYNTLMWGNPHFAMQLNGGDMEFQQVNIVDPGETAIVVNGGTQKFSGVYFYRNTGNFTVCGGAVTAVASMTPAKEGGEILENVVTGGIFEEKYTWSK